MKVTLYPRALRDLEAIEKHLIEVAPASRVPVLCRLKQLIDSLEFWPRIGTPTDTKGRYKLAVVAYPYVIYYRVTAEELFVMHVRHTSRRPINPRNL